MNPCFLHRAWCEFAEKCFRQDDEWQSSPRPTSRSEQQIRRRIRRNAFLNTPARSFPTVRPSNVTRTPDEMWSVMLRRHLGVRVHDDNAPLYCSECTRRVDALDDHASDLCNKGLGWSNRHKAVYALLGKDLFSTAGLNVQCEVLNLLPGRNLRPADALVTPRQGGFSPVPPLPVAYDVTPVSPFQKTTMRGDAKAAGAVALAEKKRKHADLARKLAAAPGQALLGRSRLGWRFVPLRFDSLGALSESTSKVMMSMASP
eukprot:GFKZ01005312.1.p1 GENE.GFKZ01005312.1~~GFKZ01005312.1.p1  ORF type:complete len:259 (-),score=11.58 GFKZ01005312.1:132-908(-)